MSRGRDEVLVVGAGPTGLFVALELARHGVPARVIEREPAAHRQARATTLQPGTLEILARGEILDRVLAQSERLHFARLLDVDLQPVGEVAFAGAGCDWEFQATLPQWRTEEIIADRFMELGGVVERGVTATSLRTTADGVRVGLARTDGTEETVEVQWLIGAGGAHSVTRASMNELLIGATYPGMALVADVRVDSAVARDASALIATPQGYVLLAPLPDDRWITFIGDLQNDEAAQLQDGDCSCAIVAGLHRRVGDRVRLHDIAWAAPFHMHRRLVSRLAGERRFLLGDAGHLSSPFGGEGLNSGLHDAHNLAWKLALVLAGRGRGRLLQSFASERLIADTHVLDVSDGLHQMAQEAVQAARTGVRPDPPTPDQALALMRSRSMLDVSYAGTGLIGQYVGAGSDVPPSPAPGDRYPGRTSLDGTGHHLLVFGSRDAPALDRVRQRWRELVDVREEASGDTRQAGLDGSGAILVRPDGHIGFRASPADAAGLQALDQHLDSSLIAA